MTVGLLNLLTHIFLVPVSFSPWIFRPPLREGGLIVICGSWSNPLWQLVYPPCVVKLGQNVKTSLGVWTFRPSDSWICTFPCFLGHFLSFFVLCSAKSCCFYIYIFFKCFSWVVSVSLFVLFSADISHFCSCVLSIFSDILRGISLHTRTRLLLLQHIQAL